MDDVLTRIDALLGASRRDPDQVERTLTDGYAEALALEAEGKRLERRLAELVRAPAADPARADELARLAGRIDGASAELVRLRGALARLKRGA